MFGNKEADQSRDIRRLKSSRQYALYFDHKPLGELGEITAEVRTTPKGDYQEVKLNLFEWWTRLKDEGVQPVSNQEKKGISHTWKTAKFLYNDSLINHNMFGSGFLHAAVSLLEKLPTTHIASTVWYFVRSDCVVDDPHFRWSFFVAYDDQIVLDSVDIHGGIKEEARLWDLFLNPRGHETWRNMDLYSRAHAVMMYRKYFKETKRGQIEAIVDELIAKGT